MQSPLTSYLTIERQSKPAASKLKRKFRVVVFVLVVLTFFNSASSVFAPEITIGAGEALEFGQGSQNLAACDSSILINLGSEWNQGAGIFRISTISLSDLDTTVNQCFGKNLTIQLLDASGTPLDINPDPGLASISYTVSGNQSATDIREFTLDPSIVIDATLITRVTVETS